MNLRLASSLLGASLLQLSCDTGGSEPLAPQTERSPNAELKPAPLASAERLLGKRRTPEAVPSALAASTDPGKSEPPPLPEPVPFDPNQPPKAKTRPAKEDRGYVFDAVFETPALGEPTRGEGVVESAHERLREYLTPRISVELWRRGRMRLSFQGHSLPLPKGTTLLSERAHYGHLLVWPDASRYRVLDAGALSNLFAEGRPDVSPTVVGEITTTESGRRLGFVTRRQILETPSGKLTLEQGNFEDLGRAGPLLCRFLAELVSSEASTELCLAGWVPLFAQFSWKVGGELTFEVETIARRREGARSAVLPPPEASFVTSGLPERRSRFVSSAQLATLREPGGGSADFKVHNYTPWLTTVLFDGLPVAAVPPNHSLELNDLPKASYAVGFRTFLGRVVSGNELSELPVEKTLGTSPEDRRRARRTARP